MAQLKRVFTDSLLTRTFISSAALGLCICCGVKTEVLTSETGGTSNNSATGGTSNNSATGGAPNGGANSTVVCPSVSGHVSDVPSGTCSGTGSCTVVVDARCGPGVNAIPATPPTFKCQCISGNWSCTVTAGGFGLIPCGDAGDVTIVTMCNPSSPPLDTASMYMGEACTDADMCSQEGCFSTGSGTFRTCLNHQVQALNSTLLDVNTDGAYPGNNDGVSWSDCESALANGKTGEACTWNGAGCSRATDDPCCVEVALGCTGNSTDTIRRYRICAPGCAKAIPDNTRAVVTDCASAPTTENRCHSSPPCQGNFVCSAGLGVDVVPFTDKSVTGVAGILWCAGGNLVGGYAVGASWPG